MFICTAPCSLAGIKRFVASARSGSRDIAREMQGVEQPQLVEFTNNHQLYHLIPKKIVEETTLVPCPERKHRGFITISERHIWRYDRVLKKKQPSTENHIDTYITPATPKFNVVLGIAEHYEQKWQFSFNPAKHIIQSTTLNWGTGATSRLWSCTS
jgi:hypothetical protein